MRGTLRATALAALLLAWSAVSPRIPQRWNPLPHAVFGAVLAASTRAPLGMRPPALQAGLRWGAAAATPVVLSVAASVAIPGVRQRMAGRTPPDPAARWVLLQIPLGTVWSEEIAYRAALGSVAARAFGEAGGRLFTAAVFGLSHLPDARAAGESVPITVVVTGAAGWIFSALHAVSGSMLAPMLAHLAINEAGAVAALAVTSRRCGRG